MTQTGKASSAQRKTFDFLAKVLNVSPSEFDKLAKGLEMSGTLTLINEPEFWADTPWRLEPDQDELPVSFHVRDANVSLPKRGSWRLDRLCVEQRLVDGHWYKLRAILPAEIPDVDEEGMSQHGFWVYGISIGRHELQEARLGARVHLRVLFEGSFSSRKKGKPIEVHLETFLAEHPLPLGRAAQASGARHWFYGDTHYHSAYTNDVKEFGGAVPEARRAGQAIGLDWLVITDHSCDLDEVDDRLGTQRRWDVLKREVANPSISDDHFRCILGEEITLLGAAGAPLHLLALGSLEEMVPGDFLPLESTSFAANAVRTAISGILSMGQGYPPDTEQRLFGPQLPLNQVLEMLPKETLVFAAHPYNVAQVPPARWRETDLSQRRLNGYEFWNGRIRISGKSTYNPFDRPSWKNQTRLQQADAARIASLKKQAEERWDPQLQRGVRDWSEGDEQPGWRPVFIGGSDAHCDFNYHVGWAWDYRKFDVDDNALGRVRTVIHLPDWAEATVPPEVEILEAMRQGACVVTDGPILEAWLEQHGVRVTLGETLTVKGSDDLRLSVTGHSIPEFGPVQAIEVISYMADVMGDQARRTVVRAGATETVTLGAGRGYVRIEAQTTGTTGEGFCCFTNPIWIRLPEGESRSLKITLT
jgi:hypothetical protein